MGTIGANCSWVARAMTPRPPPQPHGWVRLGFEVLRFPHFWKGGWHVPAFLGVWSLGLFSPTFSSTSSKKENQQGGLPDREASLIKKECCRCEPHPLQVISSRARPPLVKGSGCIGPLLWNSRVGLSGPWPPLHCGGPKTLHWRLLLVPHCTLRLSHLSVGGNARGLEIVGQLDM